ncbi:MAG: hypothetical protein HUK20_04975 [Fibrobacter sp.]|nr:hypothetical protein [Fibrobacter sp.]
MGNIVLKITALIFGIVLWFLVISQKDFQLTIEVPLTFAKLPETMAIASKPPQAQRITVEGRSWDLIRMQRSKNTSQQNAVSMVVDLQGAELGISRIHLDSKNFYAPNFPDIHFVDPETQLNFIDIDIDTKISRNIPIKSNVTVVAAQGYLLSEDPQISPEELKVSGARNALARIIDIPTDSLFFDSLKSNQTFTIPLNFSKLPTFVSPSDSTIQVSVKVQKMTTKVFENIPVNLIGFYDKEKFFLEPQKLSVSITGGEETLKSIKENDISLVLEYNRFAIEDADSLAPTPKINLPTHINREMSIKAIELKPEKVCLKTKVAPAPTPAPATSTIASPDSTTVKDTTKANKQQSAAPTAQPQTTVPTTAPVTANPNEKPVDAEKNASKETPAEAKQ